VKVLAHRVTAEKQQLFQGLPPPPGQHAAECHGPQLENREYLYIYQAIFKKFLNTHGHQCL